MRCYANSSLVRNGYQIHGSKMDARLVDASLAVDDVTSSADLWTEAPLEYGQIQYLNNHRLGHNRSEFEDGNDPATKSHLYRLLHRSESRINCDS